MNDKVHDISAGLLMYRIRHSEVEVFLVHLGGPLFAHKWDGYFSIPKGLLEEGEELLQAAKREFEEETGMAPDGERYIYLGTTMQKSGKIVHAWAFESDWPDGQLITSNLFSMEWPPNSGTIQQFPENDHGQFFSIREARTLLNSKQVPLLDRLVHYLESESLHKKS